MGYVLIKEEIMKKIEEETLTDYEKKGVVVPLNSIEPMLEDLLIEIEHWKEKYQDLLNQVQNGGEE